MKGQMDGSDDFSVITQMNKYNALSLGACFKSVFWFGIRFVKTPMTKM